MQTPKVRQTHLQNIWLGSSQKGDQRQRQKVMADSVHHCVYELQPILEGPKHQTLVKKAAGGHWVL